MAHLSHWQTVHASTKLALRQLPVQDRPWIPGAKGRTNWSEVCHGILDETRIENDHVPPTPFNAESTALLKWRKHRVKPKTKLYKDLWQRREIDAQAERRRDHQAARRERNIMQHLQGTAQATVPIPASDQWQSTAGRLPQIPVADLMPGRRPSVNPQVAGSISLPQLARLPAETAPISLHNGPGEVDAAMRPRRTTYYEHRPGTLATSLGAELYTDVYWPHRRHVSFEGDPSRRQVQHRLPRKQEFKYMLKAMKACVSDNI